MDHRIEAKFGTIGHMSILPRRSGCSIYFEPHQKELNKPNYYALFEQREQKRSERVYARVYARAYASADSQPQKLARR